MKYKYQLIILGSDVAIIKGLLKLFKKRIADLNLPKDCINFITRDNFEIKYSGNQPAFAFYFGDVNGEFKDLDAVYRLLKEGTMILPIYFTDKSFSKEIPCILENQNGILYKKLEEDKIVNIALESFELLRSTRKVFISYKRNESSSVAVQLFEALEAHNFDVFLDTHSIGKGQAFQDELWHRMTDCDVIVLLSTPGFLSSHWCKEEFAEAGAKQIGIVQLVWPNHDVKMDSTSHISYPKKLYTENFVDDIFNDPDLSKLEPSCIEEIVNEVESVRARNLAARQDGLITDFRNIADTFGREIIVQPERFLTEDLPNGERVIYIPTIGIPQAISCQTAEIKKELLNFGQASIRLIYDDLRIREKWIDHLDWLNKNLNVDIKTLKKQDFESWLSRN